MLDLVKYISSVKNGEISFVKELLANGFNQNLINDLVTLPAANLNEIQDCFSISIDGRKLSKKIRFIKKQREYEFEIDSWVQMGLPYKLAKKHFGLTTNDYSNRRKYVTLEFDDGMLQSKDISIIYSTFQEKVKNACSKIDALKETHLSLKNEFNLKISIKKINEVCCEYD